VSRCAVSVSGIRAREIVNLSAVLRKEKLPETRRGCAAEQAAGEELHHGDAAAGLDEIHPIEPADLVADSDAIVKLH